MLNGTKLEEGFDINKVAEATEDFSGITTT